MKVNNKSEQAIERSQHDNKQLLVSLLEVTDARLCNQKWDHCNDVAVYKITLREEFEEFSVVWPIDKEYCLDCMVEYLNQDHECMCGATFNTWRQLDGHQVSLDHVGNGKVFLNPREKRKKNPRRRFNEY